MEKIVRTVIGVCLFCFAGSCIGLGLEARPQLTLAIINKSGDKAVSDLLFAELAGCKDYVLVERELAERIAGEFELALAKGGVPGVGLGGRLKAQALLLVESDEALVHLRLVETARGQRVFDVAVEKADVKGVCERVRDNLQRAAYTIRLPEAERRYVALLPIVVGGSAPAVRDQVSVFGTLVNVGLSQLEKVVMVERKDLADVVWEKAGDAADEARLRAADVVIRTKVCEAGSGRFVVELQVRKMRLAQAGVIQGEFTVTNVAAVAMSLAGRVGEMIGAMPSESRQSRLAEAAKWYHVNGVASQHRKEGGAAMRLSEVAYLIEPRNDTYAIDFSEAVFRHLGEVWKGRSLEREGKAAGMQYVENMAWLRKALAAGCGVAQEKYSFAYMDNHFYRYLAEQPISLSDDDRLMIAGCRAELRRYLEGKCVGGAGWLVRYFPVLFDEPGSALSYFKGRVGEGPVPWFELREHMFTEIKYWDVEKAKALWTEYLLDLFKRAKDEQEQYAVLYGLCRMTGGFAQGNSPLYSAEAKTVDNAKRLFAWLNADRKNLVWVAVHDDRADELYMPLQVLGVGDQSRYFEQVLLEMVRVNPKLADRAFLALQTRYWSNVQHKKQPADRAEIARLLNMALIVVGGLGGAEGKAALDKAAAAAWYVDVMGLKMENGGDGVRFPEIDGGKLLFDSLAERPGKKMYFDGFNGWLDDSVVWVGWNEEMGIGAARIDLRGKGSVCCELPVRASGLAVEAQAIVRAGGYLYVADRFHVAAVPVSERPPYFEAKNVSVLGQGAGVPVLKDVTALVGGKAEVYIANAASIYRWSPGAANCELVCAADVLTPGPLNDCVLYNVLGGCVQPGGGRVFFFLTSWAGTPASYDEGQRCGVWEYTPGRRAWRQIAARDFGPFCRVQMPPTMISSNIFAFSTLRGSYSFDMASGGLSKGKGLIIDAAGDVGWDIEYVIDGVQCQQLSRAGRKVFSVRCRDFEIKKVIPCSEGLIVLLAGRGPGGTNPTRRGLVYLLPAGGGVRRGL